MADDRQNASTMEQLGSLRNFMDERRGRVLPRPVGAAITTIKGLDAEVKRLEERHAHLKEKCSDMGATGMKDGVAEGMEAAAVIAGKFPIVGSTQIADAIRAVAKEQA